MHMYNFFVCMVEKNVQLMCLCYLVLQVSFVLHCCVKQRTFRFEKAASRQQKIYIMKKAIMLHSCMSCHCTSCHFLIIQLDDENFNHMPSPIFCDMPLTTFWFLRKFKSICCKAKSKNVPLLVTISWRWGFKTTFI